jgi:hypothetical protein
LKGHGFTGCGKLALYTNPVSFVTRARLQPGRKCSFINAGFSPCYLHFCNMGCVSTFFRSLFGRAAERSIQVAALAAEG